MKPDFSSLHLDIELLYIVVRIYCLHQHTIIIIILRLYQTRVVRALYLHRQLPLSLLCTFNRESLMGIVRIYIETETAPELRSKTLRKPNHQTPLISALSSFYLFVLID